MIVPGLFGSTYVGSLLFLQQVRLTGTFSWINGEYAPHGSINEVISDVTQLSAFHNSLSPTCIHTISFDSLVLHEILNEKHDPVRHPFGSYSRPLYIDEIADWTDCMIYPRNRFEKDNTPECNHPIRVASLHSQTEGKNIDLQLQRLLPVYISPIQDDPNADMHLLFYWLSPTGQHSSDDRVDMIITFKEADFLTAINPDYN